MGMKGLLKFGENKNGPHSKRGFSEPIEENDSNLKYYIPETKETGNISQNKLSEITKDSGKNLDERIAEITYESEKGYKEIASQIISTAGEYLSKQCNNKKDLRNLFVTRFTNLLFVQYGVLVLLILLNSFDFLRFNISEVLLNRYIISVFAETLGVISTMIAFSFSSKEESNIVKVLTTVIDHYQKYKGEGNNASK